MKKLIIIILLFICYRTYAQAPVSPVGPITTNTLYYEPSTGLWWYYNGATYGWRPGTANNFTTQLLSDSSHFAATTAWVKQYSASLITYFDPHLFFNPGTLSQPISIFTASAHQNGVLDSTDYVRFGSGGGALLLADTALQTVTGPTYFNNYTVLGDTVTNNAFVNVNPFFSVISLHTHSGVQTTAIGMSNQITEFASDTLYDSQFRLSRSYTQIIQENATTSKGYQLTFNSTTGNSYAILQDSLNRKGIDYADYYTPGPLTLIYKAWADAAYAPIGSGGSTGVNGLNGTTNIGLGGSAITSNTLVGLGTNTLAFGDRSSENAVLTINGSGSSAQIEMQSFSSGSASAYILNNGQSGYNDIVGSNGGTEKGEVFVQYDQINIASTNSSSKQQAISLSNNHTYSTAGIFITDQIDHTGLHADSLSVYPLRIADSKWNYITKGVADSLYGTGAVAHALTMNNSGSGATSGTTFNGSSAQTISYNTIGAQPTLVSGTNIKTVNSTSLLGSGNVITPNFANTDLTFTGNRSHTLGSNVMVISNTGSTGNQMLYVGTSTSSPVIQASAQNASGVGGDMRVDNTQAYLNYYDGGTNGIVVNDNITVTDGVSNTGGLYTLDYSANGITHPRWLADYGANQNLMLNGNRVNYATTGALPTCTYANGTAGLNATLTATANGTLTVDGTVQSLGAFILVKNQASGFQNGPYTVTNAGSGSTKWVLTRFSYSNAPFMQAGSQLYVQSGTANAGLYYYQTTIGAITIGTTNLAYTALSTGGSGVTSVGAGYGMNFSTITSSGNVAADSTVLQTVLNFFPKGDTRYAKFLTPTAVKTSSYTAVPGDIVKTDATSGTVPITLPTAPTNGTLIWVKMVAQGGSNTTTITAGGSDVFNISGGVTSISLIGLNQSVQLQYNSGIWLVYGQGTSIAFNDLRYSPILALTTTGSSGAATLSGSALNIPNYTLSGLGGVPTTTTVAGFALSGNVTLASLTATNGTLTLTGTPYNGSATASFGINLATANTWTGLITSQAGITLSGNQTVNAFGSNTITSVTSPQLYSAASTLTDNTTAASTTLTYSGGTVLQPVTIAATNTGEVITNGGTLIIGGNAVAGTHVTITNPYGLINGGNTLLQGNLNFGGTNFTAVSGTGTSIVTTTSPTLSSATINGTLIGNVIETNSTPGIANFFVNASQLSGANNTSGLQLNSSTNINARAWFNGTGTGTTIGVGNSAANVIIGQGAMVTTTSGTNPMLANLALVGPSITLGTGSTTAWATTLDIDGPAVTSGSGTLTNPVLSLLVRSGNSLLNGNLTLGTAGNRLFITEGSGSPVGQTTLVSGTKAITITGLTTSSRAFVTLVTASGVTLTTTYQAVCTSNTLTIQANVAAGTINTSDGSTLNYFVIN